MGHVITIIFFFPQDQIAHMKNYIARFGHGSAKLARQAQSKEKTLAKMVAGGLTEKVKADRDVSFYFFSCGEIPPPVIMVQVRPITVSTLGLVLAKIMIIEKKRCTLSCLIQTPGLLLGLVMEFSPLFFY